MITIAPVIDRLREAVGRTTFANVIISHDDAALILHALDAAIAQPDGLQLTPTERSLFRALKVNAGVTVSSEDLQRNADAPRGRALTHASLSVHMRRLRIKLKAHNAGRIDNIRGIGYQWREAEHG
jgi:DNA-binding response OmpR family regulator